MGGQLHIAETVIREPGLPYLLAAAFERVIVGLPGAAQVRGVERAVGIEHLGVAQRDRRAGRAVDLESHSSDHVLAEVENPFRCRPLLDLVRFGDRLDFLNTPHHRATHGIEFYARVGERLDRQPARVVIAWRVPPGQLTPGVIALTHLHIRL